MSKIACDWCEAFDKSVEDFKVGDLLAWDMVPHTYWGDGKQYYQKAVYCPMCGRHLSHRINAALHEDDAESILALAAYGMKISEAAQALYVHRNTLIYRLDRVRRTTGLNPYNFTDLGHLVPMAKHKLKSEDDNVCGTKES